MTDVERNYISEQVMDLLDIQLTASGVIDFREWNRGMEKKNISHKEQSTKISYLINPCGNII